MWNAASLAALVLAGAPARFTQDWYVDVAAPNCASGTGGPSDPFCAITDALAVAVDGDTIHVAPGTYAENLVVSADVTLLGTGGAAATVIDGGRAGSVIKVPIDTTVAIDGFTVQNGRAIHGSGIHVFAGSIVTLSHTIVQANDVNHATLVPDHGAGLCIEGATLLADDCQIVDNSSGRAGAGIHAWDATVVISGSTIRHNRAGKHGVATLAEGGGIYAVDCTLTVTDSTFDRNVVGSDDDYGSFGVGGSIDAHRCTVTLSRCTFADSEATWIGGAVSLNQSTSSITDCEFRANRATGQGGGLYVYYGSTTLERSLFAENVLFEGIDLYWDGIGGGASFSGMAVVTDCIFADNAAYVGGGVATSTDAVTLSRCTITRNRAAMLGGAAGGRGGGVYASGTGTLALVDCEVTGNEAIGYDQGGGGGVFANLAVTLKRSTIAGNRCINTWNGTKAFGGGIHVTVGTPVDLDHVVIAGNFADSGDDLEGMFHSLGHNCIGDTAGATITGDPTGNLLDVDPKFADPVGGDYSLAPTSPCIDAGDPLLAPTGADLGGNPRLLDGDLDRVMVLDLGAHEFAHVHLAVTGAPVSGGTLTFTTSGTAGLPVLMFLGVGRAELAFPRYGALFVDLSQFWLMVPWGTIPSSLDLVVDPTLPLPLTIHLQELALDGAARAGNFGNLVVVAIE